MEVINQESLVSPGDLREAPISITTTEANLTGSWKFFKPVVQTRISPCQQACPLHIPIPSYLQTLRENSFQEALHLLREYNPLPATTGRVCPHFCQQSCNRRGFDQEILVGCVEQYLGDLGLEIPFPSAKKGLKAKICILGSGPAGLSAAYFLAREGAEVTIFEKGADPGGLLRYGIPEYRLPKDILKKEIANLCTSFNLNLKCHQEIQEKDLPVLLKDFDYLFCAPGLGSSLSLPQAEGLKGVSQGLELLNQISNGYVPEEDSFAIIGGGNVAVDVARSLVRLGKKVRIIYRRSKKDMPAYPEEVDQALEEGVKLQEQRVVQQVRKTDQGLNLDIHEAVKDSQGISAGSKIRSSTVQGLVLAIGQKEHMQIPKQDPNLLIGGDFKTGPATVVQAMAQGREAAERLLFKKSKSFEEKKNLEQAAEVKKENFILLNPEVPLHRPRLASDIRKQSFTEANPGLSKEEVFQAAERCLNCGTCTGCGICWYFCPDVAITLQDVENCPRPEIDLDHCKGCGLCAALCPRGVISMQEDK